jgi:hypothetical protein
MDLLVPVGHPRHARRSRPHHRRRHRTRAHPGIRRPDPADRERDRPPTRHHHHPAGTRLRPPSALVAVATPPPAPSPNLPLPATSSPRSDDITIYGWSTKRRRLVKGCGFVSLYTTIRAASTLLLDGRQRAKRAFAGGSNCVTVSSTSALELGCWSPTLTEPAAPITSYLIELGFLEREDGMLFIG